MNNVNIYGNAGTGKTYHARALAVFYGMTRVVDEFRGEMRNRAGSVKASNLHHCLLITEAPIEDDLDATDRVIAIQDAILGAGL